ncbi:ATP-grasp fold amidoligase family protein [Aestuariibius sp. 2305UL40-4]|uniref:ATP-grasp fold amidoligase family protein n=1 Tax=Aestuariibius violaceus TaxID=3234132 RepID=UPI00345E8B13
MRRNGQRPSPAFPLCAEDKGLWRRVFDHDPRFITVSDKLAAKDWVRQAVTDVEIPQVLWQGTDPGQLPQPLLGDTCVVKTNHGSGANIFVRDGVPGYAEVVENARSNLGKDHARRYHEWGYFGIPRRVFVEEMIGGGAPLTDMKIHTVGPDIVYLLCLKDRFGSPRRCYWEPDGAGGFRRSELKPRDGSPRDMGPLPETAPMALDIARRLGAHFDYMRVDLLTDGRKVWFGELTVYPGGGIWPEIGHLPEHHLNVGWDLRKSWFLSTPQQGWRGIYARFLQRALDRQHSAQPKEMQE